MAENVLTPMFSWLGWAFVPGFAASTLQSFYYKLTIPVGQAPPRPGTPLFAKHHRRIRILVLTLYLVYTFLQSLYDIRLAGDFFTLLSVTPSSSDREIKSRFRRLAAKYHPDKVNQQTISLSSGDDADTHFLLLKTAQDTLLSPTLRYAYTRFGPSITRLASLPNNTLPTIQTYILSGLRYNLLPSYLMNIVTLAGMNYFLLPSWGSYWRYMILTSIFTLELYFLTHSDLSFSLPSLPLLGNLPLPSMSQIYTLLLTRTRLRYLLPPHLLPYQTLLLLRNLSISLNIFISQLAPPSNKALDDSSGSKSPNSMLLAKVNESLTYISAVASRAHDESTSLLQLQLTPYKNSKERTERLREGMRDGVVKGALLAREEVRDAVTRVVDRRRSQPR